MKSNTLSTTGTLICMSLKVFTHQLCFGFFVQIICMKNRFRTADWAQVFSHRMRISRCKKATPSFFQSKSIFPNICAVNKRINQSRWLCGVDVTSISHNNSINNDSWQAHYPSLSTKRCLTNDTQIIKTTILDNIRQSITNQFGYADGIFT